jgi:hypothetical protein
MVRRSARRRLEQPPADDIPEDGPDADEGDERERPQPNRELDQGFYHEQGDGTAHHRPRRARESDWPVVWIHFHMITFRKTSERPNSSAENRE